MHRFLSSMAIKTIFLFIPTFCIVFLLYNVRYMCCRLHLRWYENIIHDILFLPKQIKWKKYDGMIITCMRRVKSHRTHIKIASKQYRSRHFIARTRLWPVDKWTDNDKQFIHRSNCQNFLFIFPRTVASPQTKSPGGSSSGVDVNNANKDHPSVCIQKLESSYRCQLAFCLAVLCFITSSLNGGSPVN